MTRRQHGVMTRQQHGVMTRRLAGVVVLAVVTSCGVGGEGKFREIKDARVQTIAPTTTTTTTPPTTTPPTTLPVATSAASTTTSTTRAPTTIATVEERLFYISGTKLKADVRRVPGTVSIQSLLIDLGTDPTADKSLRTAVRSAFWGDTSATEAGVAIIELRPAFGALADSEAQLALAQIVYTVLSNIPGVGQVQFTRDGRPFSVPRSIGTQTNGEPVSKVDYPDFIAES